MKKSQLYGQIFIYILTIVVVSIILLFGYNAVRNFNDRAEQVSCLKFRNDIKNSIEGLIGDFGTVKRKDLELCGSYTKVCFVETFRKIDDITNPIAEDSSGAQQFTDKIIQDSISTGTDKNVFLISKTSRDSFYTGNISIAPATTGAGTKADVLCLDAANSRISLKLEGRGDHVDLSAWLQ